MNQAGKLLKCLLPMLVGLLCQVIIGGLISIICTTIITAKKIIEGSSDTTEQLADTVLSTAMDSDFLLIVSGATIAVSALFGVLWYKKYRTETDGTFKQVVNGKLFITMLMLGLSLQCLISLCLSAVFSIIPETASNQYAELMDSLTGGNIWISIVVTVIIAPIAEEFLFRGVTMKMGEKVVPFFAANLIQAFLFGVYHLNLIQGIYAFVLGLVLGYVVKYFHSIWPAILLHAFTNGAAQLLSLIPEDANAMIVYTVTAILGVVLLFGSMKLFPNARNKKFTENSFDE